MAEEEDRNEEESSEEAAPQKQGKGKLIIIIAVVLLLAAGGGAAYFFLFRGAAETEVTETTPEDGGEETTPEDGGDEATTEGGETTTPTVTEGVIFPLEHFIVNVNDMSGNIRYLKIEIKLELEKIEMQPEIENRTPKIRDSIVTILTNKSVDDISNTSGKVRLKEEIKARINTFLTTGKITEVYFTDFIIQ